MAQTFFHVNTLMRHINLPACFDSTRERLAPQERELIEALQKAMRNGESGQEGSGRLLDDLLFTKIGKRMQADNVVVMWNESGREVSEDWMARSSAGAYIIIRPLVTNFCEVTIAKLRRKRCGSMPNFTVVNDAFLPRIVMRGTMVADTVVQRVALGREKGSFMSALLKRCAIVREIKRKVWSGAGVRGIAGKFAIAD